mmetsp:Transcript_11925/g.35559  ORF Transcript_11925/g.35559 Transcript_11925/m.35559 type:complete len:82 (+) Transcript_11925:3-248(+)
MATLKASVLALFRGFLREARAKDPDGALGLRRTVAGRFRAACASVSRMEFQRIEFMVREGHKKLKVFRMPGVTNVGTRGGR